MGRGAGPGDRLRASWYRRVPRRGPGELGRGHGPGSGRGRQPGLIVPRRLHHESREEAGIEGGDERLSLEGQRDPDGGRQWLTRTWMAWGRTATALTAGSAPITTRR